MYSETPLRFCKINFARRRRLRMVLGNCRLIDTFTKLTCRKRIYIIRRRRSTSTWVYSALTFVAVLHRQIHLNTKRTCTCASYFNNAIETASFHSKLTASRSSCLTFFLAFSFQFMLALFLRNLYAISLAANSSPVKKLNFYNMFFAANCNPVKKLKKCTSGIFGENLE